MTAQADSMEQIEEFKKLFLDNYLLAVNKTPDKNLKERIQLYYNWTMMRTAIFWFLGFKPREESARKLLDRTKRNLGL